MNIIKSLKSASISAKKYSAQLFADAVLNTTSDSDLSPGMKIFYDTALLQNVGSQTYFAQFGKQQPLPKHRGKKVEWRKWNTFTVSTVPLQEGITPTGDKLGQTSIEAEINQYGRYAYVTDVLSLTHLDDVIGGATELFGDLAAQTMDIVTRNSVMTEAVKNVLFPRKSDGTAVASRDKLDKTCQLTPRVINKAVAILKKNKAPKINGSYIGIIHPSVSFDLRDSDGWKEAHKYAATKEIFNGEIGELHGVRFVESDNAKVYTDNCPVGYSVYSTLVFGKDAWGVVKPDGASLKMIVKQVGSGGADDPLGQRGSVGFKFSTASAVLYPTRLLSIETVSAEFANDDEAN